MRVLCDDPIHPGWFPHSFETSNLSGVFIAKVTCKLQPGESAEALHRDDAASLSGDVFAEDELASYPIYATDFAPFKIKTDLLFIGDGHVPQGGSRTSLDVRWQVGEWAKKLKIIGDREWIFEPLSIRTSAPKPFSIMAIEFSRAFGSEQSKFNPTGTGAGKNASHLPNIEDPARPIKSPHDEVPPAGFGPLAGNWQSRTKYLGTYGEKWKQTRWPWFPEDFDYRFFNAAPIDQQLDRALIGNEEMQFENLHAKHALYRSRLPGFRVRCFVDESDLLRNEMDSDFREVTMQFDTLQIDMGQELAFLLWRGTTPIQTLKMREIKFVFMMTEPVGGTPKSSSECFAEYQKRRGEEEGLEFPSQPTAEEQAEEEQSEQETELLEKDFQAAMAQAEQHEIEMQSASGASVPQILPSASLADLKLAMLAAADSLRGTNPKEAAQFEAEAKGMGELEVAEAELAATESKPITREEVERRARNRESFRECDLSELELYDLDLSGLDFTDANLSECMLDGTNLTRANLTNTKLVGADLTQAILDEACLSGADFSEAILADASFRNVEIDETIFNDLELQNLDFSGAHGSGADFSGADLTGAKFVNAKLPQCNFSETILNQSDFRFAELKAAQFEKVKSLRIDMSGADLSGLHGSDGSEFLEGNFRATIGVGAIWEDSVLDGADFTDSNLQQSLFTQASLRGAILDRTNLTSAVFDDADLEGASLQQSNFLRASFDRANLTNASLRESNFYNAGFWDSKLANTDLRDAKTAGTTLPS